MNKKENRLVNEANKTEMRVINNLITLCNHRLNAMMDAAITEDRGMAKMKIMNLVQDYSTELKDLVEERAALRKKMSVKWRQKVAKREADFLEKE